MKKAAIELRVSFAELDGMRAVYHTNHIKWFDLVRTKLLREAGFEMEKWEASGILLPLVVCHCEYKASTKFDDLLEITATVEEVKGKVITITYEIINKETGKLVATGMTKQVTCDENSKPFVLEEKYPELYKNLTEDHQSQA
jgi:acyl-CoA thioester hydrolase